MATQKDFNENCHAYITYYCNVTNGDTKIYSNSLSEVCTITYDEKTENLGISNWLIKEYPAPTLNVLLSNTVSTVLKWYEILYIKAQQIKTYQYPMLSNVDLNKIKDPSLLGMIAFDNDNKIQKTYNGKDWVPVQVTIESKSVISIGSSDALSISFTNNTPRLIPITGFTSSINKDFTFNASTGECKYVGTGTNKPFRCSIMYSYVALSLSAELRNFVSKNNSLVIPNVTTKVGFILLGQGGVTLNSTLITIQSLSTNDSIIFAGVMNANQNVTFSYVSYSCEEI